MRKQLIIVGITIAIVIVIFVGLIIWIQIPITTIEDISSSPGSYFHKKVTVEGHVVNYWYIWDDSGHYLMFDYDNALAGMYRLTGSIEYGKIHGSNSIYYLDVTDAKVIQ